MKYQVGFYNIFLNFFIDKNFLEACTSLHEDSITCPLEVSELEPHENNLSDIDNKILVNILDTLCGISHCVYVLIF